MERTSTMPAELTAFSPIILFELLLGLPTTAILFALVIKSRTELTNSSIYLASLSIASLVQLLTAIPLLVNLLARQSITGSMVCSLSAGVMIGGPLVNLSCHFLLSRNKYNAVKNPAQWDWIKSSKAYIYTITVWSASLLTTVFAIGFNLRQKATTGTNGTDFGCFVIDSNPRSPPQVIAQFGSTIVITVVYLVLILATSAYHFFLFRELKSAGQFPNTSFSGKVVVKCSKLPGVTSELHTARSLLIIFIIQALASILTSTYRLVNFAREVNYPVEQSHPTVQIAAVVLGILIIHYIPTLNPAILIVSNSRYRRRVINLLKCRYTAESDDARHLLKTSSRQLTRPSASTSVKSLSLHRTPGDVGEESVHSSSLTISLSPSYPQHQCWEINS